MIMMSNKLKLSVNETMEVKITQVTNETNLDLVTNNLVLIPLKEGNQTITI